MASIVIGRIFKREVYIDTCLYIMKERIRQLMDQAKLSQQDFAAKLGISPASLSSIFTGRTNPTNNHVMAVHRAFPDININWLMFGEGDAHVSMNNSLGDDVNSNAGISSEDFHASPEDENMFHPSIAGFGMSDVVSHSVHGDAPTLFSGQGCGQAGYPEKTLVKGSPNSSLGGVLPKEFRGSRSPSSSFDNNTNFIDKQVRKIKEIRVFFDDGTYEAFVPSSK